MPYLNKKELKQLKGLNVEAKLLYLFALKPAKTPGYSGPQTEDQMADTLSEVACRDHGKVVANKEAIEGRLNTMISAGTINAADADQIRKLVY